MGIWAHSNGSDGVCTSNSRFLVQCFPHNSGMGRLSYISNCDASMYHFIWQDDRVLVVGFIAESLDVLQTVAPSSRQPWVAGTFVTMYILWPLCTPKNHEMYKYK
jgi:hypothetical protein